jgi:4-carboxymuconolactone decarboxylase
MSMTRDTARFHLSASANAGCPAAPSERFLRGLARLRQVDGDLADRLLTSLAEIAPDFACYVVEFPFGDIYSRPGLDLKTREIATIAALTALGYAPAQLKAHIGAALNVGCTQDEIVEVIMQMAVYAGFPAALNGLAALKDVAANGAEHWEATPAC